MTYHEKVFELISPREEFIEGMSRSACTVNVVTSDGIAGRAGITVSAMSSVTADSPKPELLICVNSQTLACSLILENGVFCVNLLNADQHEISDIFAGRSGGSQAERFNSAKWTSMRTGSPRLINPVAAFDCRIVRAELFGTHYVIIGAVGQTFVSQFGSALVYADRSYRRTCDLVAP
jgi:flavin reductase (DIM6/NTAB) family NADH-FMN oxidoreductase RutF